MHRRSSLHPRNTVRGGLLWGLLIALLIAGCTPDSDGSASETGGGSIDWVNFIRFDGITYMSLPSRASSPIDAGDIDSPFAEVQFKVAGEVTDRSYQPRDGDAAFLEIGTVIYRLSDYEPSFRLAVRRNGDVRVYEAIRNPAATRGRDLLDIAGKVESIRIKSTTGYQRELALIDGPDEVSRLVELVVDAPVNASAVNDFTRRSYVVVFQLVDGSEVTRFYWPDSGELQGGVILPPAFVEAVERVASGR